MASFAPYADRQVDRALVRTAMKTPLLEAEAEHELAKAWRDNQDEAALHKLTAAYLRLVIAIAARFKAYGLPMSDLVQEGSIGLMQAAARFDPEREVRFSTYASWWIRSAIQDYVLRNWSIVRTGTTSAQKSLFFNLRRMRALIREDSAPHLSPEGRQKIATQLRVPLVEVEKMEARIATGDRSLNATVSDESESEWIDNIADNRALPEDQVMEEYDAERRSEWINTAMESLSQREVTIIKQRRLKDDGDTLEALGKKLGISKERVRQIESVALGKLKNALLKAMPDPIDAGLISA